MNPSEPTRRSRAYTLLRDIGLTHHQVKHLVHLHMSHLGDWHNLFYKHLKADREVWAKPAELVAQMCMREDPKQAGRAIYHHCWGEGKEDPECPYTCASMAGQIVSDTYDFNVAQKRILWKPIERILSHEKRQAEAMWVDRMLKSFLQTKEVL